MNDFVYSLPPANVQVDKSDKKDLQGYLELEVSLINFIYNEYNNKINLNNKKPLENKIIGEKYCYTHDTPLKKIVIKNNKNSKNIPSSIDDNSKGNEKGNCSKNNLLDSVQVKIVWCGERTEDAANISISCKAQHTKPHAEPFNLKTKRNLKGQNQTHDQKYKHQKLAIRQYLLLSANNKLRYRICTNGALFLEYLRSCEPLRIIVSRCSASCTTTVKPLGQVQFNLPFVLLKKFHHNIVKGHNFKYKTKVYSLYNQSPEIKEKSLVKSGEIQLCFKMLFAPKAASAASAVAVVQHPNVIHDKHHIHKNHYHHRLGSKTAKMPDDVQGDIPRRLTSHTKSEEIVEAMKKLDAKLVAYLAGEAEITSKLTNYEEENEVNMNLENNISNNLEELSPVAKFNIFKAITGIKLEMEALTLQSDGTKSLNLMQNEIQPIFTVECQLSNELIKLVPRHDMFHIMQFESEKFQSLTQCVRFAQKAERAVKLDLNADWSDENANEAIHDFGRIHFTVWWRQSGTCLNEMLGMGVLELNDLYNASLLEQCKRIEIQRRDKNLACLYFKVTLQRDTLKSSKIIQMKRDLLLLSKETLTDSDNEKTPTTDKNKTNNMAQQQAAVQRGTQSNTAANSSITTTDKVSAQNNNAKIDTTNFDDETSKIRLLKGFISVSETRNLEISLQLQTILVCRRFWLDEPATANGDAACKFNYQEQFSVINDEKFLQRMDKQYMHLELWQRMSCDDGNGNPKEIVQPVGIARMPLHQFFIAYRDATITNHLCKGKLPVISIDAWTPIINCQSGLNVGEIKCLLAVGSDEQIKNLKTAKGITVERTLSSHLVDDKDFITKLPALQIPTTSNNQACGKQSKTSAVNTTLASTRIKKTSELLDVLQKALTTSSNMATNCKTNEATSSPLVTPIEPKCSNETSSLPLKPSNIKLFKFSLEIQKAIGLPINPASKARKGYSKRNASKRFPPNEAPSCYVTFQAEEGQYPKYKSHEGLVFATNIVEKSTEPQWQQRFRLAASIDYLKVPQKLFILKVLKKSSLDLVEERNQPTPMEDAIIGLTALDLTPFVRGLHIAGSFNIVDFNGRIIGQLMLRCQPIEDVAPISCAKPIVATAGESSVDSVIDQFEQTLDLTHLNLGQAIKRKFTELEGISQRLRARLGDVTGNELPKHFDLQIFNTWQPIENEANDDKEFDEFERDLNTPPIEEEKDENHEYQGISETDDLEKSE